MPDAATEETLLDAVALAFPLGGISELTRNLNSSYKMSVEAFKDDPRIRQKDFKPLVGHLRRALINDVLLRYAEQYSAIVSCVEKMEGEEGDNNHVELRVGDFLVTHHHHTKSDLMPEDFINLSSTYNQVNAGFNEYFEPEWFREGKAPPTTRERLLNLLLLHEKSRDGLQQVGNIEFVFPRRSKKFIVLGVSALTQRQSEIMDLEPEDLFDFRRRTADQMRRLIA